MEFYLDRLRQIRGFDRASRLRLYCSHWQLKFLALAITQDSDLKGILVPGSTGERHIFPAFVDGSTVFLEYAKHLPRVLQIVAAFGKLSVLTVQPAKRQIIYLNTSVAV